MDKFRFNDASAEIYSFTWHLFCDWYIEIIKDDMTQSSEGKFNGDKTNAYLYLSQFTQNLPSLYAFCDRKLNSTFKKGQELLVTSSWPLLISDDAVQSKSVIDFLINIITEIRSIRSELRVAPSIK